MKIPRLAILVAVPALLGLPAFADFNTTFTANGNSSVDGRAQDGTAQFKLSGSTFTITLTNTETATTGISGTLVGVVFTFDNGDTGALTGINNVSPASICDFTSGTCTAGAGSTPFMWG